MTEEDSTGPFDPQGGAAERRPLSGREREIVGMLAEGLSGAAIAKRLVLSPETVRTHVRNAMEKLGAATRSQAVAISLEGGLIGTETDGPAARAQTAADDISNPPHITAKPMLTALLAGVVSLADVEAGAIYLADDDGMLLKLAANATSEKSRRPAPPDEITLGDAGVGRVALERRARLITATSGRGPILASPMTSAGKLAGVLALEVRQSRPTSRRELLLIEAFANRIAEIITDGADAAALRLAFQRFRASWTETIAG